MIRTCDLLLPKAAEDAAARENTDQIAAAEGSAPSVPPGDPAPPAFIAAQSSGVERDRQVGQLADLTRLSSDLVTARYQVPQSPPGPRPSKNEEMGNSALPISIGDDADPIEAVLAEGLQRAAAAAEWSTVEILSRELQARREARANVVTLNAERKRRR